MRAFQYFALTMLILSWPNLLKANEKQDYHDYHMAITMAEELLADEKCQAALLIYEQVFSDYGFIFLREYQVATQLALYLGNRDDAFHYLRKSIVGGWKMKSIRRNEYLAQLQNDPRWRSLKKNYHSLRDRHKATLNMEVLKEVRKCYPRTNGKSLVLCSDSPIKKGKGMPIKNSHLTAKGR